MLGDRLRNLDLEGFSNLRVLVAGDFMLDEYLWGKVERISPEAPVAVVEVERETRTLGGAGNVVNNLVALGAQVEVLGLVGDDNPGRLLNQEMVRLGVAVDGLFTDPGRRTSRKTRVIGASQQVVRIDRETRTPAPPAFEAAAREFLSARLPGFHALVLSDYAKGVLTPGLLQELIAQGRSRGLPVVVDPKGADYSLYAGATVITPNRKEAELAVGYSLARREDLVRAGAALRESLALDYLLITLGAEGMLLFAGGQPALAIPTRAREVFDVSGAGDTVAALMALGLAQWGDPVLAAALANVGAGVVVGKMGTAPIYRAELARELGQGGDPAGRKNPAPGRIKAAGAPAPGPGEEGGVHQRLFRPAPRRPHQVPGRIPAPGGRPGGGGGLGCLGPAGERGGPAGHRRGRSAAHPGGPGRGGLCHRLHQPTSCRSSWRRFSPTSSPRGAIIRKSRWRARRSSQGYGGQVVLVPVTEPVSASDLIQRIKNGG